MTRSPAGRLLAVSWEMPPLSGPRAVQVTRTLLELSRRGWRSRVVCFGPRSTRYQQDYRTDVERESGGAVRLERVASPEEWLFFRALWRLCPPVKRLPDEKRVWVGRAVAAGRRLLVEEPADVVVSFAQPWSDHLIGLQLHRETGLPWVAHFSDPWVDNPYEQGPAWQMRRQSEMERAVIEAATRVVFVNRHTADRVMAKYPANWRSRVRVVPQGFEPRPVVEPLGGGLALSESEGRVEGLHLVYTGRFYRDVRTPESFLRALSRLNGARPLAGRLTVTFVGADMAPFERQARGLGLDGITVFTGRRPPDEARATAARADVLLAIDAPSDDGPSLFLPSKLIDYLPFRRPILGLTPREGASADLLRALGYPIVDPSDVEGIASALDRLLDQHASGTLVPSVHHDELARAYDIRETTRAFEAVLLEALGAA